MELIKHSTAYLFARGGPAIIHLIAMGLYTRLITPDAYGRYILVLTGASLGSAILFQWLRLGLLRFHAAQKNLPIFMSTILVSFAGLILISLIPGAIAFFCIADNVIKGLVAFGLALMWIQSFFALNLEIYRAQMRPNAYGWLAFSNALIALLAGGLLAWFGFGAGGLLAGVAVGSVIPTFWCVRGNWHGVSLRLADFELFRELFNYGMPLTLTFAFAFIVSSSDRFFLGGMLGASEAGLYSVGYDLAKQAIGLLMMIINLAAYPLAVQALEQQDRRFAETQLTQNCILLFAVGVPSMVGLMLLAPNISGIFLGQSFRESAVQLIPWVSLGAFLAGIKAYYVDLSFQLGRRTMAQATVVLVAAAVNVLLNVLLIPNFGMLGAAYATVITYAIALFHSWLLGRRIFPLPFPLQEVSKILMATVMMGAGVWFIRNQEGVLWLVIQIVTGAVLFLISYCCLNVSKIHGWIHENTVRE